MNELKESIRRAIKASNSYNEQRVRLNNIAEIYELSLKQVISYASSWFGEDYKRRSYERKSLITKDELVNEIANKLGLEVELCDSLSKVNKGILIRINNKLKG